MVLIYTLHFVITMYEDCCSYEYGTSGSKEHVMPSREVMAAELVDLQLQFLIIIWLAGRASFNQKGWQHAGQPFGSRKRLWNKRSSHDCQYKG